LPVESEKTILRRLFQDSRGRVWIGTTDAGLFVIENGQLTNLTVKDGLPDGHVSPRVEDRNGNIWAVTGQGAVIISDGKITRLTTEQGLSENDLASIYEDREGNIWIGTRYRGLNRVSRQSVTFYTTKEGLAADVVHPIYEDRDGNVWIGGRGLTRYSDGRFEAIEERGNSTSKDVTAIHQDRRGRLWFGYWGGVFYTKTANSLTLPKN
jgi:ligand-binding sensor domain-containing protein